MNQAASYLASRGASKKPYNMEGFYRQKLGRARKLLAKGKKIVSGKVTFP